MEINLNNNQNIIIYCRVSSIIQKEKLSLSIQEEICKDYCIKNNFNIIEIIKETASAKFPKNQKKLLNFIDNYNENNSIKLLVYNISR